MFILSEYKKIAKYRHNIKQAFFICAIDFFTRKMVTKFVLFKFCAWEYMHMLVSIPGISLRMQRKPAYKNWDQDLH